MTDDDAKLHAELSAVLQADMRSDLADVIASGGELTPDVIVRLKASCMASVASLCPGFDVYVDPELGEVRLTPR